MRKYRVSCGLLEDRERKNVDSGVEMWYVNISRQWQMLVSVTQGEVVFYQKVLRNHLWGEVATISR